jgi:hypothetical protein
MKRHHHIISLAILFAIGILFVHSELDFFTPEQHDHYSHDFCDIVDSAKPENFDTDGFHFYDTVVPVVFLTVPEFHCFNSQSVNFYSSEKPFTDVHFSILYSTFLI